MVFISPGGIVALGKFDALHIGHRELAIQAAKVGAPFLLSFVGMAEVLGWEPRYDFVMLFLSFPLVHGKTKKEKNIGNLNLAAEEE